MQIACNTLPQQPAAKIIIDGLFVLCLNEDKRKAEVWVYEYANDHDFFIRVSKKESGDSSESGKGGELVQKLDDKTKTEIKSGDISIAVANREPDIACFQHDSLTSDFFYSDPRDLVAERDNKLFSYSTDFRWIIDVEGKRFHDKKLEIVPGVLCRKITIPNGVLYTHRLVKRMVLSAYQQAASLAKNDIEPRYFYVTNQLGIAINELKADEVLSIFYSVGDKPQNLPLQNPEEGFYYEIYVSNNCPESEPRKRNRQSDFQHYYNVLNVPVVERMELDELKGSGNRITPCDLIFLGQTSEI